MRKKGTALLLAILMLTSCARPGPEGEGSAASPAESEALSQAAEASAEEASPPEPTPQPEAEEAEETAVVPLLPDRERMLETVQALCVSPRPMGSEEERRAAELLQDRLTECGYEAALEPFSYNITGSTLGQRYRQARELTGEAFLAAALPGEFPDGESQNVVGRQPREKEAESILVLSAHYDSTWDSPGVIDNAAGVAVVLEAARILAAEELPFALRIVFFGGEEEILIGSRQHLLGMSPAEAGRILGNISVDTLACSPREEFVAWTPLTLPRQDAATLAERSPVAAALLADSRVTPVFTSQFVGDHMAFSAAGIDSVSFGQPLDPVAGIINTPADTYEYLEPALLPVAAQLLTDAVRELAKGWEGQISPPETESR